MKTTIGDYIAAHFKIHNVKHIFGVPGDYNLALLEQLETDVEIDFINNCNELNASYAADGYARTNGLGGLIVTYGVGDLAALSGIAGAYAESVPVVCISGTPPLHNMKSNTLLHHSLADGNFDNIMNCFKEFTVAQALITPENASVEVPRLFKRCFVEKKPVYLQLPSDICDIEIEVEVPNTPWSMPQSDQYYLNLATDKLTARLLSAKNPIIIVDQMVDRFSLQQHVLSLSAHFNIPFANMTTAKAVLSESSPGWLGAYCGDLSRADLLSLLDDSDCVISLGARFVDSTTAYFSHHVDPRFIIDIKPHSLFMDGMYYPNVQAEHLLEKLSQIGQQINLELINRTALPSLPAPNSEFVPSDEQQLSHATLWPRINRFIQQNDIIAAENGTSGVGIGGLRMPDNIRILNQPIWGSIGYTLPALLGSMMAAPEQRHLLFIGDGSLQLVAQEIATFLRFNLKPILFVVNNNGYTIERYILGEQSSYNDISHWDYAQLPKVLGPHHTSLSLKVHTLAQLDAALEQASNHTVSLCLIELILPEMDTPEVMKTFCHRVNQFNFGARNKLNTERVTQTAL